MYHSKYQLLFVPELAVNYGREPNVLELIKVHIPHRVVYSGTDIILTCAGDSTFHKDGEELQSSVHRVNTLRGLDKITILLLNNVSYNDSGKYHCSGSATINTSSLLETYFFSYTSTLYVGGKQL